ncbi:caspase-8-like isoform X4 [Stigmatopora argus]
MDRQKMIQITQDLDSPEVAALCFLCRDVLHNRHIEGVTDAKVLLNKLEEQNLMRTTQFLDQLLRTIRRHDLLQHLGTNREDAVETDASPMLSNYRVMLYRIYDETTKENLQNMKFLLSDVIKQRKMDECKTVLDVFVELEKVEFLSQSSLTELHSTLMKVNPQLASIVEEYMQHRSLLSSDAETNTQPTSLSDQAEYYAMTHIPRGLCVIINIEEFLGKELQKRPGTQEDEKTLKLLFSRFGFNVIVHKNLTGEDIRTELKKHASRIFSKDDALVVCVLSHGESGCVFGSDENKVFLRELTQPFTSGNAPTLAGKPKLFFIQACQGKGYQTGSQLCPPNLSQRSEDRHSNLETDAAPIHAETVASDADFLVGMATVPECKAFRNKSTGSIYIQELCKQLQQSAESQKKEDILTVLTRVNREVSRGVFLNHKQMPEPKYTLTKTLVLKFVDRKWMQLASSLQS